MVTVGALPRAAVVKLGTCGDLAWAVAGAGGVEALGAEETWLGLGKASV